MQRRGSPTFSLGGYRFERPPKLVSSFRWIVVEVCCQADRPELESVPDQQHNWRSDDTSEVHKGRFLTASYEQLHTNRAKNSPLETRAFLVAPYSENSFIYVVSYEEKRLWIDRLFVDRVANYVFYHSGLEVWEPQEPFVVRGSTIVTNRLQTWGLRRSARHGRSLLRAIPREHALLPLPHFSS